MPTPTELKAEIETGPLAADLATPWNTVFPTEDEPSVEDAPTHARWERIRYRFGMLTPDACFDLLRLLNDGAKRTKLYPLAVATFTTFLASRGLLRKIRAAVDNDQYPDAIRDICDLVVTVTAAAPDRTVDPSDAATMTIIDALVASGIATSDDRTAFLTTCTRPASRLQELGWIVTEADLQAAKAVQE